VLHGFGANFASVMLGHVQAVAEATSVSSPVQKVNALGLQEDNFINTFFMSVFIRAYRARESGELVFQSGHSISKFPGFEGLFAGNFQQVLQGGFTEKQNNYKYLCSSSHKKSICILINKRGQ
jgi:hypothetical protein